MSYKALNSFKGQNVSGKLYHFITVFKEIREQTTDFDRILNSNRLVAMTLGKIF